MFLEVTDSSANHGDWSCFVSHRLSVVNQRSEDKSVAKESQNRYSKQAKDWGWREFVTLTSLFDLDAGFLVNDCVMFAAEVLVLRETSELKVGLFCSHVWSRLAVSCHFGNNQVTMRSISVVCKGSSISQRGLKAERECLRIRLRNCLQSLKFPKDILTYTSLC